MDITQDSLSAAVLLSGRLGGLVLIAPVFSHRFVPTTVKVGLIVLLSIILLPAAHPVGSLPIELTPASFVSEMVTGFAIGLGAALIIGATESAGDFIGMQVGLSGSAVFDPTNNATENILGVFASLFATTLVLSVNGHLVMLDAVSKSYGVVPMGAGLNAPGLMALVRAAGNLFSLGLQFAAPVIAVILVTNTALAILNRAAPQLNVLSIAFPLQIALGLFALAAALPAVASFYGQWTNHYGTMLSHTLTPLAMPGRP